MWIWHSQCEIHLSCFVLSTSDHCVKGLHWKRVRTAMDWYYRRKLLSEIIMTPCSGDPAWKPANCFVSVGSLVFEDSRANLSVHLSHFDLYPCVSFQLDRCAPARSGILPAVSKSGTSRSAAELAGGPWPAPNKQHPHKLVFLALFKNSFFLFFQIKRKQIREWNLRSHLLLENVRSAI